MYYFLYMTMNLINGKYYIGVHKTNDINDGYLGSGLLLNKAIKKYGRENFKRYILNTYNSLNDAFKDEKEFITEELAKSKQCYNVAAGGHGGHTYAGKSEEELREIGKKISEKTTGKIVSDETRELTRLSWIKRREEGNDNSCFRGREVREETREKISKTLTGRPMPEEQRLRLVEYHRQNPMVFSEESKEKIRIKKLGVKRLDMTGDNNFNVKKKNKNNEFIMSDKENLIKMYVHDKMNILQVAKYYSTGHKNMKSILQDIGITLRRVKS